MLQSLIKVYQFVGIAKEQTEVLEGMHKRVIASYQQMAKYFCFDAKKYAMDEFFGDIKMFIDGFVVCSLYLLLSLNIPHPPWPLLISDVGLELEGTLINCSLL